MKRLLLLAGEESGAVYARQIADEVRRHNPLVEIRGYEDYGFSTGELGVFGIFAVLRRLFYFLRVRRTMVKALDEWRPDVVCTIDYPGMNLRIAAEAKIRGIRAVHVVCPQVWAWHHGRIPRIEASLDRLCCFFPFEPQIFKPGFAVFVGHPLAHAFDGMVKGVGAKGERTVAILPGSRQGEIERILPVILETVERLAAEFDDVKFVLPAANRRALSMCRSAVEQSAAAKRIAVTDGGAREALGRAECAIVASGTATLEAALIGCPTVLVYRVSPLTAFIARRVIRGIGHVGLANIVAEKSGVDCPMPELLQERFTAEATVEIVRAWLNDGNLRKDAENRLRQTIALLQTDGESDPIGRIAVELK